MSTSEERLQANLQAVHERISLAARVAGRDPASIRLLAVSKAFGAPLVAALARAGQLSFGENYVQEALAKMSAVRAQFDAPLEWHFIGPIQSNKTRAIAESFDWVQSVDRLKVAQRLSEQRPSALAPLNVLLQVNISGEASKRGVEPAGLTALAAAVALLPRLQLRGLMAIPEPTDSAREQRAAARHLRQLFDEMRGRGLLVDTLSIGMSDDLEAAIAEGSTLVRVGTAIFGARPLAAASEPA